MPASTTLDPAELKQNEEFFLRDVRILGRHSANQGGKRTYLIEALRRAIPLFEGEPVNINHDYSILHTGVPRGYTEQVGILSHVRCDDEGLFGDVQLNPHKHLSEAVRWDYKNNTKKIGLSFLGDGDGSPGKPDEICIITKVLSIDVVQKQATTQSLREAEEVGSPMYGRTEHEMLLGHEKRLCECETKLGESTKHLGEATEQLKQLKQVLAEVEMLKTAAAEKPKGVHIHPELTPAEIDLKGFVKSISRVR